MGPQLVVKSLALIWRNLGPALRATAVPLGIGLGLALLVVLAVGGGDAWDLARTGIEPGAPFDLEDPSAPAPEGPAPQPASPLFGLAVLVAILPAAFGFLWAAVAWHRFVLLEEVPGIVPALRGDRIGSYLWAWVRLIGPILLVGLVVAFIGSAIAAVAAALGSPALAALLLFGLNVLAVYGTLRFSLVLPAAAVGRSMGVFESWARTKEARDAILVAAALLAVLNGVIGAAGGALGLAGSAGTVLSLALSWFGFVLGLSILTAIYGHVVEGRPLE